MKIKLGLLYGGKSAEHQVSLQTALAVIKALNKDKFEIHPIFITSNGEWVRGKQITDSIDNVSSLTLVSEENSIVPNTFANELFKSSQSADGNQDSLDVIFPLLHGTNGEDGTVQGLLELLNLPYVGNGVLASATGMDKVIMKQLFAQAGLKQVNYVGFTRNEWHKLKEEAYEQVEEQLGYPCFVKPANLGSSVGISKCNSRDSLEKAFDEAFTYDRKIIIEAAVVGREIEVGVLGNDEPEVSVAGEIVPKDDFYDYKAKYEDGDTALIIPADITTSEYEKIHKMAIKAFKAIDGTGLVRADFFLTEDSEVYINEVNTMPGFTPVSMFPLLWQHTSVTYPQLIEKLVQLAIERHEEKQQIKYTF
ncbi:D-alanine--D-alanine ligase [Cytobacillus sp. Hm23]